MQLKNGGSTYRRIKEKYCDFIFNGAKPRSTLFEYVTKVGSCILESLQKYIEFKERQHVRDN